VKLTTSYPVIRGPSDAPSSSRGGRQPGRQEAIFDLFAQGPKGWDINFSRPNETKYISSIRLKANQSQNLAVEVKPAPNSARREYPHQPAGQLRRRQGRANLTVILTGTYALEAGTTSGLLSLEARQGQPANISFYVKNTGSAVNHDIKFMTSNPRIGRWNSSRNASI